MRYLLVPPPSSKSIVTKKQGSEPSLFFMMSVPILCEITLPYFFTRSIT